MTSWKLDNTTFHYWTLNETGEVIWGYPKHGDEVIIDDRFKYIFKSTEDRSDGILKQFREGNTVPYTTLTDDMLRREIERLSEHSYTAYTSYAVEDAFNESYRAQIVTSSPTGFQVEATLSQNPGEEVVLSNVRYNFIEPTNDLVSDHVDDQADEISTYMREAQQMINNGR